MRIDKKQTLSTTGAAVAVAWSSNGSFVAAASDFGRWLTVWSRDGRLIKRIQRLGGGPALGQSIGFADGSSKLIFLPPAEASPNAALSVWDVTTASVIGDITGPQPGKPSFGNRTPYFQISTDQTLLIAANNATGVNLLAYDLKENKQLSTGEIEDGVFSLGIFEQGKRTAVGMNAGKIGIFDNETGKQIHKYAAYDESNYGDITIGAIAGSPDGSSIFAGAGLITLSNEANTVMSKIWLSEIKTAVILQTCSGLRINSFREGQLPIRQAKWDPAGRYVAFVDNGGVLYIWRPMAPGSPYKRVDLDSPSLSLAISADGDDIAVGSNTGISIFSVFVQ